MSNNTFDLTDSARKVVGFQILATVIIAVGFFAGLSEAHGRSAFYGGLIGIALTVLLSRGVRRAELSAATNPRKSMAILYMGAAQRFFLALAAFAVGLAYLHLEPLPVFIGFAVAQFSYLVNARTMTQSKRGV